MSDFVSLVIEAPDGQVFECDVPVDTPLSNLAADFFEERDWPTTDARGRGHRAVVERVDPTNPERTKRLRGEQTVDAAGLENGARLRIFPESTAGVVDERHRTATLVQDHNGMIELAEWNPRIRFDAKPDFAPTFYTVFLDYPGFAALADDRDTPVLAQEHRVEITLGAQYPWQTPFLRWMTSIFHPNIDPHNGAVCLGVLMENYLPGLGLARLVTMLAEMVQYRNFDMSNALNQEAAEWSANPDHWLHITGIGGSPFQGPVGELFQQLEETWDGTGRRPRLQFRRLAAER